MTAPTLVSYTEIAAGSGGGHGVWNAPDQPRSTASISWQSGDILVAVAGCQDGSATLTLPTATGLTFASVFSGQIGTSASNCGANIWTATAGGTSSSAVAGGWSTGSNIDWGLAVWVFRGSSGVGNHAGNVSAETLSLTRSGANSAVVCGLFDWNATASTGYAWTPTVSHDRQHSQDGTNYSYYVADWSDEGSSGSSSYGISGVTGGPFTNVLVEILGSGGGGGGSAATPQPIVVPSVAVHRAASW